MKNKYYQKYAKEKVKEQGRATTEQGQNYLAVY